MKTKTKFRHEQRTFISYLFFLSLFLFRSFVRTHRNHCLFHAIIFIRWQYEIDWVLIRCVGPDKIQLRCSIALLAISSEYWWDKINVKKKANRAKIRRNILWFIVTSDEIVTHIFRSSFIDSFIWNSIENNEYFIAANKNIN